MHYLVCFFLAHLVQSYLLLLLFGCVCVKVEVRVFLGGLGGFSPRFLLMCFFLGRDLCLVAASS